jgi:hypothetical protein
LNPEGLVKLWNKDFSMGKFISGDPSYDVDAPSLLGDMMTILCIVAGFFIMLIILVLLLSVSKIRNPVLEKLRIIK